MTSRARFLLPLPTIGAPSTVAGSHERHLDPPQPVELHDDAVAGGQPHRLDQAPGQDDLAGVQATAFGGKVIGEPGQRVVRMP